MLQPLPQFNSHIRQMLKRNRPMCNCNGYTISSHKIWFSLTRLLTFTSSFHYRSSSVYFPLAILAQIRIRQLINDRQSTVGRKRLYHALMDTFWAKKISWFKLCRVEPVTNYLVSGSANWIHHSTIQGYTSWMYSTSYKSVLSSVDKWTLLHVTQTRRHGLRVFLTHPI